MMYWFSLISWISTLVRELLRCREEDDEFKVSLPFVNLGMSIDRCDSMDARRLRYSPFGGNGGGESSSSIELSFFLFDFSRMGLTHVTFKEFVNVFPV